MNGKILKTERDRFHMICCRCRYRYGLVEGVLDYEAHKTPAQEEVKIWLQERDIDALIIRCPKCGLLHLMVIFLFDRFLESVMHQRKDDGIEPLDNAPGCRWEDNPLARE